MGGWGAAAPSRGRCGDIFVPLCLAPVPQEVFRFARGPVHALLHEVAFLLDDRKGLLGKWEQVARGN